jgi:hypothetical protein
MSTNSTKYFEDRRADAEKLYQDEIKRIDEELTSTKLAIDYAEKNALTGANSAYETSKATYGTNADKLSRMGLSGSGYASYLDSQNYGTYRQEAQNIKYNAAEQRNAADKNADDLKYNVGVNYQNTLSNIDDQEFTYNENASIKNEATIDAVINDVFNGKWTAEQAVDFLTSKGIDGELYRNTFEAAANKFNATTEEEKEAANKNIFATIYNGVISGTYTSDMAKGLLSMYGITDTENTNFTSLIDSAAEYRNAQTEEEKSNAQNKEVINIANMIRNGELTSDEAAGYLGLLGIDKNNDQISGILKSAADYALKVEEEGKAAADVSTYANFLKLITNGAKWEEIKIAVEASGLDEPYVTMLESVAEDKKQLSDANLYLELSGFIGTLNIEELVKQADDRGLGDSRELLIKTALDYAIESGEADSLDDFKAMLKVAGIESNLQKGWITKYQNQNYKDLMSLAKTGEYSYDDLEALLSDNAITEKQLDDILLNANLSSASKNGMKKQNRTVKINGTRYNVYSISTKKRIYTYYEKDGVLYLYDLKDFPTQETDSPWIDSM